MKAILSRAALASALALAVAAPLQAANNAPAGERSPVQAAEQFIGDSMITTEVKARFAADEHVSAMAISVETNNGEVQLSGFSPSPAEKARAEEIARTVEGVKGVQNDIAIRAGS